MWHVLPIKAYALPDLLADWRCKGNQKAWSLRSKFKSLQAKQVEQSWNVKTWRFFSYLFCYFLSIICISTWSQQNDGRFDPFEILEVSPGASAAEVKKANLQLSYTPLDFWDEVSLLELWDMGWQGIVPCQLMSRINDVQRAIFRMLSYPSLDYNDSSSVKMPFPYAKNWKTEPLRLKSALKFQ